MDITTAAVRRRRHAGGPQPWVEMREPDLRRRARQPRCWIIVARELRCFGRDGRAHRRAAWASATACARRFSHPAHEPRPGILIMGHLDTVHPVGTLANCRGGARANRCYGPGIFDMKGGNYLALEAVRASARPGLRPALPVTFLFTSDEEVGSPSTRDLIEAEAARHNYVLVPEPGAPDGGVVTGRYAIARFNLEAIGRPSHAGARLEEGRSAIRDMADMIPQIEGMTTRGLHLHRRRHPWRAVGELRLERLRRRGARMAKRQADLDSGVERMLALSKRRRSVRPLHVTRGVTRPVWEPNAKTHGAVRKGAGARDAARLRHQARKLRRRLGRQFYRRDGHRHARRARRARLAARIRWRNTSSWTACRSARSCSPGC